MKHKSTNIIITTSYLIMILVNLLADVLPIGNGTTSIISNKYENMFIPADYTFSIWGLIYIFMGIYVLYSLNIFGDTRRVHKDNDAIAAYFSISCLLNVSWLFAWHYELMGLAVVIILLLLISLVRTTSSLKDKDNDGNFIRRLVLIGFEIYTGWIIVATIGSISAYLVSISWSRFGLSDSFWTYMVLILGTILGLAYTSVSHKYFVTITLIWAYIGILVRYIGLPAISSMPIIVISTLLIIMIVVVLYHLIKKSTNNRDFTSVVN